MGKLHYPWPGRTPPLIEVDVCGRSVVAPLPIQPGRKSCEPVLDLLRSVAEVLTVQMYLRWDVRAEKQRVQLAERTARRLGPTELLLAPGGVRLGRLRREKQQGPASSATAWPTAMPAGLPGCRAGQPVPVPTSFARSRSRIRCSGMPLPRGKSVGAFQHGLPYPLSW